MVSLLLIISFLIHIILLLAVYYLYTQLQLIKNNKDENLQELLTNFIHEIRAENEQLKLQLDETKRNEKKHINAPPLPKHLKPLLEKQEEEENRKKSKSSLSIKKDRLETSLEVQIAQLSKQGLSIEEIAKKLNKGKTEVELILKLNESVVVNT